MAKPLDSWGDTRMGNEIRAFDWATTPLGPIGEWPVSLRTIIEMILGSKFPQAVVWGPDYTTIYNDAFIPILGKKAACLGQSFAKIWHEAWHEIGPIADKAYRGESTFVENFPLNINRHEFEEQAYFTFSYSPLRNDNGEISGFIDTVVETTETVRIQQTQETLRRELVHRIKNTLGVASAVLTTSLRNATSLEQARETISNRIEALAKVQDLLGGENDIADIGAIVSEAIGPHLDRADRVELSGPQANLSSQQAVGLSLAVYELATNALKYGALSNSSGRIIIRWVVDRDQFRFQWSEIDGPEVISPSRSGFGSRLTTRIVGSYFFGKAETFYDQQGVRYEINGSLIST